MHAGHPMPGLLRFRRHPAPPPDGPGAAAHGSVPRIVVQVIVPVILGMLTGWLVKSLGDLARYTDDSPDNIDMRQAIRQRVVSLLEKLHNDERYGRIVVVGHSLGGIVAYDALRLLWAKRTGGDAGDIPGQLDDGEVARAAESLPEVGFAVGRDLKAFCEVSSPSMDTRYRPFS